MKEIRRIFITTEFKQLDLKDQEKPLQNFYTVAAILELVETTSKDSPNFINLSRLILEPNEFTDYTDPVGFLDAEIEPQKFLTTGDLNSKNYVSDTINDYRPRYKDRPFDALPITSVEIYLGGKKNIYERSKYTIFTLLGDLGGFYSAIVLIPSSFMSLYASKILTQSLSSQTPTVSKNSKKSKHEQIIMR